MPDAAIGIILSGTSTQRQRIQRLGRIIRKKDGKGNALLYYLHITDSSEDSCFLPDIKGNRIFDLDYLPDTGEFCSLPYTEKASALLADWTAEKNVLEQHIQNAKSTRERNYWICMKKLAES